MLYVRVLVLSSFISGIASIQTKHRPPRYTEERAYGINEFPIHFDWEHGLRESTVQALYKEYINHENIRQLIYSAPFLGKQNRASPFGDISVLARGQLYANHAGFIFVQDKHSNECDDCEDFSGSSSCLRNHCPIFHPRQNEQLIVLWTVRRIRHRYLGEGHKYEIDYTISPINIGHHHERYLTRQGRLNYNVPGHIFVLRIGKDQQKHEVPFNHHHHKNGVFIAQTPDGSKYILHSFPAYLTSESPRHYGITKYPVSLTTTKEYPEEDEKKIYQTLLEVLHQKTSPQIEKFTPTCKPITTLKATTLGQVPTSQVVPLTRPQTPYTTKSTTKIPDTTVSNTTPQKISTTLSQHTSNIFPITTYQSYPTSEFHTVTNTATLPQTYVTSTSPRKTETTPTLFTTQFYPITKPLQQYEVKTTPAKLETTSTRFTTQIYHTTPTQYKPTSTFSHPITTSKQTTPLVTHPKPTSFITTQNTIPTTPRTTFHYFVAEEQPKTTSVSKPLFTTTGKEEYEDYDNTLPDSRTSTVAVKTTFSTESLVPATIPYTTPTRKYPSTFTEQKASTTSYFTTEPTTKFTPSFSLEPQTVYTTQQQQQQPSTFAIPITVYDEVNFTPEQLKPSTTPFQATDGSTLSHQTTLGSGSSQFPTTLYFKPSITYPSEPPTLTSASLGSTLMQDSSVQTTLGITKLMESIQNNTTAMTFYTVNEAEETTRTTHIGNTEGSIRTTAPIGSTEGSIRTTAPIVSTFESATTPQHIVTTIMSDGSVSVKTTPIAEEATTETSRKTKRPKASSTTEKSDFLIETISKEYSQVPLYQKPVRDYSEDDIFGSTRSSTAKTETYSTKQYTKSDIEEALFERTNNRKSKALKRRKSSTPATIPKVVYADYFEASTLPMTTQIPPTVTTPNTILTSSSASTKPVRNRFSLAKRRRKASTTQAPIVTTQSLQTATERHNELGYEEGKLEPVTRQSYLTSISYEVNKKEMVFEDQKAEREKYNDKIDETTDKVLHEDVALRLVSEVKGVEYLEKTSTTPGTTTISTENTTKKKKYTRRKSYIPRSKRPTRKKIAKPEIT